MVVTLNNRMLHVMYSLYPLLQCQLGFHNSVLTQLYCKFDTWLKFLICTIVWTINQIRGTSQLCRRWGAVVPFVKISFSLHFYAPFEQQRTKKALMLYHKVFFTKALNSCSIFDENESSMRFRIRQYTRRLLDSCPHVVEKKITGHLLEKFEITTVTQLNGR